jgi:hypothetical protein
MVDYCVGPSYRIAPVADRSSGFLEIQIANVMLPNCKDQLRDYQSSCSTEPSQGAQSAHDFNCGPQGIGEG